MCIRDSYYRGIIYAQMNDLNNALANFNKGIELEPENPIFYYYRGMAYTQLNQKTNAIADFNKVLELTDDEELVAQTTEWLKSLGVTP